MKIVSLTEETRKDILEKLLKRSPNQYGSYEAAVREITDRMKEQGDAALFAYTEKFDGAKLTPETIQVTEAEIEEAYREVDPKLLDVIRKALVTAGSTPRKREPCWARR